MSTSPTISLSTVILASVITMALGCSTTPPHSPATAESRTLPRPPIVMVYDFAISSDEVTDDQPLFQDLIVDADGHSTPTSYQPRIGQEVALTFTRELIRGIAALGFHAEHAPKSKRSPSNALVVHGAFLDVLEGRRLHRIIVGVSPAGMQLDVRVHVHQATQDRNVNLLEFMTHTESRAMVLEGATFKDDRSVMEQMAVWSAKEALAVLSDLFLKQGWISRNLVRETRRDNAESGLQP